MDPQNLLLVGFAVLGLGALVTLLLPGEGRRAGLSRMVALAAVAGSGFCFVVVSVGVLWHGAALGPVVLWQPSLIRASLSIRVDGLSAFFLLLIAGLSLASTWYAVAYARKMGREERSFYAPLLLFVLGMAGVVVVDDFFFFFVPWEFMALSSYLLVVFHKERKENLAAGFKYFFITHAGSLALFFGVALLVTAGRTSFGFEALGQAMPGLLAARPFFTHFALALILLGFLVKAGAFPFGMWWLPDAHPAAPSPASALLSGAMIKLGLYGVLRVFFEILPYGPWVLPWGLVVATFGVCSLFFGTMAALIQHDSKRLLAYHSIGQVGYMLLGFGIALALAGTNPALAAVGLIGGLFHLLNHACFKGLLFLNAGTFEYATGERDLNLLGGLGRLLPITAVCTVVASLSIAGLPPFNGFSSKWLIYHASIWGSSGPTLVLLFFAVVAIFISAVTLASFLKFMGASIWGTPSPIVRKLAPSGEGAWMGASQIALALLCVGLGVFPYAGLWLCHLAAGSLTAHMALPDMVTLFGPQPLSMELRDAGAVVGVWSPLVVTAIFAAAFGAALLIRRLAAAPERSVAVWSCGSEVAPEEMRFRAEHYYTPFKRFAHLVLPGKGIAWRPKPWPIVVRVLNPDGWAYYPLVERTQQLFGWLARSKVGLPQVYPAWNLIGLAGSFVFVMLLWWWLKGS
jgi:hydrogenase-4 component B